MQWKKPHIIKIYEALTAIADGRIEIDAKDPKRAKCQSSSGKKFYEVCYEQERGSITSNDNSAYYTGTLSYPMIAMLILKQKIKHDEALLKPLKGIHWKELNQKHKNNYQEAMGDALAGLREKGYNTDVIKRAIDTIYQAVCELNLEMLPCEIAPPKGW